MATSRYTNKHYTSFYIGCWVSQKEAPTLRNVGDEPVKKSEEVRIPPEVKFNSNLWCKSVIKRNDGTPCAGKLACTVWSGGKPGDNFKWLPIAIIWLCDCPHCPRTSPYVVSQHDVHSCIPCQKVSDTGWYAGCVWASHHNPVARTRYQASGAHWPVAPDTSACIIFKRMSPQSEGTSFSFE